MAMQQAPDHKVTVQLQEEVSQLRAELQLRAQQVATLERELASANSRLQTVAAAATGQPPPPPLAAAPAANVALAAAAAQQQQQQAAAAAAAVAAVAAPVSVALPVGGAAAGVQLQVPLVQAQPSALPLPALAAVPVAQPPQPQAMLSTSLPAAVQLQQATNNQQQQAAAQQAVAAAAAQATIQQQQVVDALAGQPKPAQPLNGTLPSVAQQLVVSRFGCAWASAGDAREGSVQLLFDALLCVTVHEQRACWRRAVCQTQQSCTSCFLGGT